MIVLLLYFSLNIFAAVPLVDAVPFRWEFYQEKKLRRVYASTSTRREGTLEFECHHRSESGSTLVSGSFGTFSVYTTYRYLPMRLSYINMDYMDVMGRMTHLTITSSAPNSEATRGCITITPPDTKTIDWVPQICAEKQRPTLAWTCKGDATSMELKRFLFHCPKEKLACVGVQVTYESLPRISVSWGEADANGCQHQPQLRIFDLSFEASLTPQDGH